MDRFKFITPKAAALIFTAMLILVSASTYFELTGSRSEMRALMTGQAKTTLDALLTASRTALASNEKIENEKKDKVLNAASVIRELYAAGALSNGLLENISDEYGLLSAYLINKGGRVLYSSGYALPARGRQIPPETIFTEGSDTLSAIINDPETGATYYAGVRTDNGGAVILSAEAESVQGEKQTGFGPMLTKLTDNPEIIYAVLQDRDYILAASGDFDALRMDDESGFLQGAYADSLFHFRFTEEGGREIFEAVHTLWFEEEPAGLFRLGLSAAPLGEINARLIRRALIQGLLLLLLGFAAFIFLFTRQNFEELQRRYKAVESYSKMALDNISDAIITTDSTGRITGRNRAAEELFGDNTGQNIADIIGSGNVEAALNRTGDTVSCNCNSNGKNLEILVSAGKFTGASGKEAYVFALKDVTALRQLEEEIGRRERLSAMGELASGVAHEIRNPLNSIGIIVQQLNKDFKPENNVEEYHSMTKLVYDEVKRINSTVSAFLRFSRPEVLKKENFRLQEYFERLKAQFAAELAEKNIILEIKPVPETEVLWDRDKMLQVFINLIRNTEEAAGSGGEITIEARREGADVNITYKDDGPGMTEETAKKVFNLYFTTKPEGTGIGLSMVQRIISEHGGSVRLKSAPGEGVIFTIKMPIHGKD